MILFDFCNAVCFAHVAVADGHLKNWGVSCVLMLHQAVCKGLNKYCHALIHQAKVRIHLCFQDQALVFDFAGPWQGRMDALSFSE